MYKKILITGATGFVGSWMTRYLLQKGHLVKVLRRQHSDISELEGLPLEHHIGDVTQIQSLEEASQDVDAIFHLAGYIGYSKSARALMEKVNINGTKNVVDVCKKNKSIKKLLYFSSVTAVGAGFSKNEILNESSPYNLKDLNLGYFETKRIAEEYVTEAAQKNEISASIVNPSTIYGPGDAKKGSRKTQLKVAAGKFPFYTSGGVSIISVQDVVAAAYRAFEVGKNAERYILAGENITIKKLFELIAQEAHVPPPKIYLPNAVVHTLGKVGDLLEKLNRKGPLNSETAWTSTLYHWFDSSKAQKELGLKPQKAQKAISESVQWALKNMEFKT